jgi:hypothetical protein
LYGNIPKDKCGGAFYFVVFVQKKKEKKNQKQKEGIKFLKKKKSRKKKSKNKVVSCIVFNFNKRLEEKIPKDKCGGIA